MKSKMGRPKLPRAQAKAAQVGVRFAPTDDKEIDEGVNDAGGQTKAEWVRNAAIGEARNLPIWVKSKWKYEDLIGNLVEFRLTAPKFWIEGVGEFLVRKNPRGELAIDICVRRKNGPFEIVETRYYLSQEAADRIESNPNPKTAPFRLLG